MKNIFLLVLVFQFFSSCEKKTETHKKQTKKTETKTTKEKIYGDLRLNDEYNLLLPKVEIINDSLKGNNFFNQNFKKVSCECSIKRNFETEDIMIRETEILIQNKIKLSVLFKDPKYIYAYNGKPFKVKNYFGEMYNSNSDISFSFDNRECYMISKTKFLMREQPSSWCGRANEYGIYQIVDLDKMEMIQFAERDDKLK